MTNHFLRLPPEALTGIGSLVANKELCPTHLKSDDLWDRFSEEIPSEGSLAEVQSDLEEIYCKFAKMTSKIPLRNLLLANKEFNVIAGFARFDYYRGRFWFEYKEYFYYIPYNPMVDLDEVCDDRGYSVEHKLALAHFVRRALADCSRFLIQEFVDFVRRQNESTPCDLDEDGACLCLNDKCWRENTPFDFVETPDKIWEVRLSTNSLYGGFLCSKKDLSRFDGVPGEASMDKFKVFVCRTRRLQ
jgi:hypothetical protein